MIQYVFSTIFSHFFLLLGWGETLKKNFSYFYVMLMPVCCQIVVTLVLHQARRHARQLRDLEKEAMRGKARQGLPQDSLSLSHALPQVVLIVFIAYFFGAGKENTNKNLAKS